MDWGAVAAAFTLVLLAELGDKPQLAVLALAAERSPWSVFLGAGVALAISSALAAAVGGLIGSHLPEGMLRWVRYAAGGLFVAFGVWTIVRAG
ncbi:MAG: TMEM165/GDT1 family protein [Candidatus Bipolaricaulaceae bacterium]